MPGKFIRGPFMRWAFIRGAFIRGAFMRGGADSLGMLRGWFMPGFPYLGPFGYRPA